MKNEDLKSLCYISQIYLNIDRSEKLLRKEKGNGEKDLDKINQLEIFNSGILASCSQLKDFLETQNLQDPAVSIQNIEVHSKYCSSLSKDIELKKEKRSLGNGGRK